MTSKAYGTSIIGVCLPSARAGSTPMGRALVMSHIPELDTGSCDAYPRIYDWLTSLHSLDRWAPLPPRVLGLVADFVLNASLRQAWAPVPPRVPIPTTDSHAATCL
jgi:hypothetical protein